MGETVFFSVHLTRENELLHSPWHMIMTMNDDDGDDGKKNNEDGDDDDDIGIEGLRSLTL